MSKDNKKEYDAMDWLRGCSDCSCCKYEYNLTGICNLCENRSHFTFRKSDRNN